MSVLRGQVFGRDFVQIVASIVNGVCPKQTASDAGGEDHLTARAPCGLSALMLVFEAQSRLFLGTKTDYN